MKRTLRIAWRGSLALAVLFALGLVWLAWDARRDRTAWFLERVGELESVEMQTTEVRPDLYEDDVVLRSTTGLVARLRVLRRALDPSAPRPAVVLLGGQRSGSGAVELIGDPGECAVAAVDYPYDGNTRVKGAGPVLAAVPGIRRAFLDTPPALLLALRWMREREGIAPDRVELVGASLGTPFVIVAAGLDPELARLWVLHGAADYEAWIEHGLGTRVPLAAARGAVSKLAFWLARGPAFDPARWLVEFAPREVVLVSARDDERVPAELAERLREAVAGPLRFTWTDGGHVQPSHPEAARALVSIVLSGIAGDLPPLVTGT